MSLNIEVSSEKYDDAIMRVSCASSLLTLIGSQFDSESGCPFSDTVMCEALYGVGMLIEDAKTRLQ